MSKFGYILGASIPSGALSKVSASALMAVEGCDYSHIHIEFPAGVIASHAVMFDARNGQVNFSSDMVFDGHMETVRQYYIPCTEKDMSDILAFCFLYCGINYSYKELAGACIARVASWLGKAMDNPFGDGMRTEMCSSIGARILKLSGVEVIGDVQAKSPKDVIQLLESQGFERIQ